MTLLGGIKGFSDIITEKTEFSQASARLLIVSILTFFFFLQETWALVQLGSACIVLAAGWAIWTRYVPVNKHRRWAAIVFDQSLTSVMIGIAGPHHSTVLFMLYFWINIGNGYRFGSGHTIFAFFISLIGFFGAALFAPEWQNQSMTTLQIAIGYALISMFSYKLLRNLEQAAAVTARLTERAKRAETKSMRDSLTGLCNREAALNWLSAAVKNKSRVGVLFLDLDGFKQFNDHYGHHVGDEVLINISRRLQRCVRDGDVVCRYAGDEFIILVDDEDQGIIDSIANRISHALNLPMGVDGNPELAVTGSIGAAILGVHGKDEQEVLRNADAAMYKAKRLGRNQVAWFEDSIK